MSVLPLAAARSALTPVRCPRCGRDLPWSPEPMVPRWRRRV